MMRSLWIVCVLSAMVLSGCAPTLPAGAEPPLVLVTLDPHATATATPFQPAAAEDTPVEITALADTPSTATPLADVTLADTALADAPLAEIPLTETATATSAPADTPNPAESFTAATPTSSDNLALEPQAALATPGLSGPRALYTLYATLDYAGRAVAVNETIRYTNNTGQSLSSLVMAVEPNMWADCFSLSLLDQDGLPLVDYTLSGQKLTIALPQPLGPGATTVLGLGYRLSLPAKSDTGTFGYKSNQVNLTDWYPFIVPFTGDWLLHDPGSFGEHLVYDAADYDVYVMVEDPKVVLAASAPAEGYGNSTHYHLEGARTFVLSASDSYQVEESAVGPVQIETYSFAEHGDANKAVLWMATQSLGLYQAKFAPYPYQSLSIVESDMADGQEYDGLVFLASKFYTDYNGSANSNLFSIGTHEVAHQWWFGLVGDDQASQPWLDEALAVYSERLFYQYNYPALGDWWWNFRVNYFGPAGYVDGDIYSFPAFREYVNAVYLNGAEMLEDLRTRAGDEAFFAFLQDYAGRHARGRATAADFFALLRQHTDKDLTDIMQKYLQGQY